MTNGAISSILRMVILFAQLNVIFYLRFIIVFFIARLSAIISAQITIRQLIILLISAEAL
jgi:hypothetical protein